MQVPGDKSIAIRALLLASVARAPWRIAHLPNGDDVAHALEAARALGARVTVLDQVASVEPGALPAAIAFSAGESATLLRLGAGLLVTRDVRARIAMAPALARRPHARFVELLCALAGEGAARLDGDALVVNGRRLDARAPDAPALLTPDASAQQKSALLLAALAIDGAVTVRQAQPTRAHTEEILAALGARIDVAPSVVTLTGPFVPPGAELTLPGDPSSAALLSVALARGGAARFDALSVSPRRMGFFDALARMGARVSVGAVSHGVCGPVAAVEIDVEVAVEVDVEVAVEVDVQVDVEVPAEGDGGRAGLVGIVLAADEVTGVLDEIPALACVCALARGPSRLCGLAALRGKESDRVRATAALLVACGVSAREEGDDLVIDGRPARFASKARVQSAGDHRIAMAALALGRAAGIDVTLDDDACVAKSYPGFAAALDAVRAAH